MAKKHPRSSFADMVAEVKSAPPRQTKVTVGPSTDGQTWGDPEGNGYRCVADEISPERAVHLLQQDALVVWDPCGCGSWCGIDFVWLTEVQRSRLKTAAPPRIGFSKDTWGDLSEWRSASGATLLVAAVNVSWGDHING